MRKPASGGQLAPNLSPSCPRFCQTQMDPRRPRHCKKLQECSHGEGHLNGRTPTRAGPYAGGHLLGRATYKGAPIVGRAPTRAGTYAGGHLHGQAPTRPGLYLGGLPTETVGKPPRGPISGRSGGARKNEYFGLNLKSVALFSWSIIWQPEKGGESEASSMLAARFARHQHGETL